MTSLTQTTGATELRTDTSTHGLWIVTTPDAESGLDVGDLVRVLWREAPYAHGYVMRRAADRAAFPCRVAADAMAATHGLARLFPLLNLTALHVERMLEPEAELFKLEHYLVRASHLVPANGWRTYLEHAGVGAHFTPPHSWQFYGRCWGLGTLSGKTGGLHMSINAANVRRCQLSVEYGVCGDSLMGVMPGTKAGVLLYISNMSIESAVRDGDVCTETSLTLSFSALLLAYAEMLSIVRRTVYEHSTHPCGGVDYAARAWDYSHVPYRNPFPVHTPRVDKPTRTLDLAEFAAQRAQLWLEAERAACPDAWTSQHSMLSTDRVHVGMPLAMRLRASGVDAWVAAEVTCVDPLEFDVSVPTHCLAIVDDQVVVVN